MVANAVYEGGQLSVKSAANISVASNAVAITPHDSNDLTYSGVVYIGSVAGGAAIKVTLNDGTDVTFSGVLAGTRLGGGDGILVKRVWSTGTTASSLILLY